GHVHPSALHLDSTFLAALQSLSNCSRKSFSFPGITATGDVMRPAKGLTLLAAASTGALLAYLLDPTQGKRRRALVRDKAYSQMKSVQDCAPGIAADVRNRAQGLASRLRLRLARAEVPDDILIERVRARIGREVAHPGSIGVSAANGEVTLTGVAL